MLTASIQDYLNQFFSTKLGQKVVSVQAHAIGGGCINETYRLIINRNLTFFLKINSATKYPQLFDKEKNGLQFLGQANCIRVPTVIDCVQIDNRQILLLEHIEQGIHTEQFWRKFGEQLAALHRKKWLNKIGESLFGLHEDNYIGSLPQYNSQHTSWSEFFIRYRLQPQVKNAIENHSLQKKHTDAFEKLYGRLPGIFDIENSSLLHGDLWSGNFMCNQNAEPVLIDPAIYFGDRSMDLAMTTLFGGFDKQFYESYDYHFPFPKNYREQWDVANLYPLLIHLNLFGPGYLSQVQSVLRKYGN